MSNVPSNTGSIPQSLLHNRYKATEVLISTGCEKVYIAEDLYRGGFPKRIIQEIQPISNDGEFIQAVKHLFKREAQILKTLGEDDRIPQLIDYLEVEGRLYLVQDFIVGQTFTKELYQDPPWSQERVIALLEEVLPILEFVHSQGIIHGNIQPDKLIRRKLDGKLMLTGLSVLNQIRTEIIAFQGKIGRERLGYIPVEQMRGILRPGSDIYALGAIAIQALTGFNPLQLEENPETGELVWPHLATVTEEFAGIITQMVRYHFRDRYHSATDILADLKSLVEPGEEREHKSLDRITINTPSNSAKPKHHFISSKAACIATSIAFSVGGYLLMNSHSNPLDPGLGTLAQANQKYQEGDLEDAVKLVQSIAPDSAAYQEAQTTISEWREDWQKANVQFQAIKIAFEQNQWSDVLDLAAHIPNIAFWEQKVAPIANEAQTNLDKQAYQLLHEAYNRAINKDFTTALNYLKKIPTQTKVYPKVQSKITEYTQKESIKAKYLLQQAYSRAAISNFAGALEYLKQIPQDTPTYSKAQEKIEEYTEKHRISAHRLLHRASNRLNVQDFIGAIAYLPQITENTSANQSILSPGSYLQEINQFEIGQIYNS
jgi:serine/threonine protein kinase